MKTPLSDMFPYTAEFTPEIEQALLSRVPEPREYSQDEREDQIVNCIIFDFSLEGQEVSESDVRDIVTRTFGECRDRARVK